MESLAKTDNALLERVERVKASQKETNTHEGNNMLRQNYHSHFNRLQTSNMITIITMALGIIMIECPRKI